MSICIPYSVQQSTGYEQVGPQWILLELSQKIWIQVLLWKCCTQHASKFGKLSSGHRTGKVTFHSNAKEGSNYCTNALISHASKVMLKILQARLQQYVNHEIPDVQVGFRKGRGTRGQIAAIHWIIEGQENTRKTSSLLTMPKHLTVWITINCGQYWKRWEYQTTWPASWEICMQVRKQQLKLDMEQQTGPKLGKEHIKAIYCHPAYLTCMQSTSWEMLGWKKHKLVESRLLGEISITSDMQMTPTLRHKAKKN